MWGLLSDSDNVECLMINSKSYNLCRVFLHAPYLNFTNHVVCDVAVEKLDSRESPYFLSVQFHLSCNLNYIFCINSAEGGPTVLFRQQIFTEKWPRKVLCLYFEFAPVSEAYL